MVTVEVYPSYADDAFRIHFFGDEIEEMESFDVKTSKVIERFEKLQSMQLGWLIQLEDGHGDLIG